MNISWGFDAVGRGEVGVTARWHYDKHFTRRPTALGSTFMGGKAKVRRRVAPLKGPTYGQGTPNLLNA